MAPRPGFEPGTSGLEDQRSKSAELPGQQRNLKSIDLKSIKLKVKGGTTQRQQK